MGILYTLPLGECEHRVIWWLIDKMDAEGYVRGSWKTKAARDLNLHYTTLSRSAKKLAKHGVVVDNRSPREVRLVKEAFLP